MGVAVAAVSVLALTGFVLGGGADAGRASTADVTGEPSSTSPPTWVPDTETLTPTSTATSTTTRSPCLPPTPSTPNLVPGQVVQDSSFDDGTVQGWYGAPVSAAPQVGTSTDLAQAGTGSLKIAGLSPGSLAARSFPAPATGWYDVTGWVRLAPGEPATSLALQVTGSVTYGATATVRATDSAWTPVTASFSVSSFMADYFCPDGGIAGVPVPGTSTLSLTFDPAICTSAGAPSRTVYLDSVVVTRDGNGPLTPPPPTMPSTVVRTPVPCPTPTPPPCTATYRLLAAWPGGFEGEVTVTAQRPSTAGRWAVSWQVPDGQAITQLWGGSLGLTGSAATVTSPPWGLALAAGQSSAFAFLGSYSGDAPAAPDALQCTDPDAGPGSSS